MISFLSYRIWLNKNANVAGLDIFSSNDQTFFGLNLILNFELIIFFEIYNHIMLYIK